MKITIAAPTGHIGGALTERLLNAGAELTLIARSPERVAPFAALGARVVKGSLEDASVVQQAVQNADALFWLTPPHYQAENQRAYQNQLGDVAAAAVRARPGLRVVNLSSVGAHLSEGAGPINGLHDIEEKLNAAGRNVTHLRAGYFMENVLFSLMSIALRGSIFSTVPGEVALEPVATRDVAALAAELLLDASSSGRKIVHLLGPETLRFLDIASILSEVLGRPVVHAQIPAPQAQQALLGMGLSADVASQFLEMNDAFARGWIVPEGGQVRTGKTTFRQFAREVALPAWQQVRAVAAEQS